MAYALVFAVDAIKAPAIETPNSVMSSPGCSSDLLDSLPRSFPEIDLAITVHVDLASTSAREMTISGSGAPRTGIRLGLSRRRRRASACGHHG